MFSFDLTLIFSSFITQGRICYTLILPACQNMNEISLPVSEKMCSIDGMFIILQTVISKGKQLRV